jgi:hypothetical protein
VIRVENVMKQANQLQQQSKDLAAEELVLKEQVQFSAEECRRVAGVMKNLRGELSETKAAVTHLVHSREMHRCTAQEASLAEYEAVAQQLRQRHLSVRNKEKQIQAVLQESQGMMDGKAEAAAAHSAQSLTQLRRAVEEQDSQIAMLTDLHDEESLLLEDYVHNERAVKELRAQVEASGMDIPSAPTIHRRRHIIERRQRSDRMGATGANNRDLSATIVTRTIHLPVGVLRLLTDKLGTLEKVITKDCGVESYSLEIADHNTLVHCKGRANCIDALESKLNGTLEFLLSGSYATSGLITYGNRDTGDACASAASKIKKALLLDVGDSTSRLQVPRPLAAPKQLAAASASGVGARAEDAALAADPRFDDI